MKIALSLGGSLLTGKTGQTNYTLYPENFKKYANVLLELHAMGHKIMVVCGGGKPARHFIETAKHLDGSSSILDMLGVKATHVNALMMMAALGDNADQDRIYQRGSDLRHRQLGKIWVGGGYKPKSSTDYRTVIFAKHMESDLVINATDVNGVYDKNPKIHENAKKIDKITFAQLEKIILKNTKQIPGEYALFDIKAVRLAKRLSIPLVFIDGRDPEEIKRAVNGTHDGTIVVN
jgi:uridylate kinase